MNTPYTRASGRLGIPGLDVLDRRGRDLLLIGLMGLIPVVIALGITVSVPNPNLPLTVALAIGALGVFALVSSSRLEVTVTLLALYLGLLDGPVKLSSGGQSVSAVRDILIFAVVLGCVLRLVVRRERVSLPPMSGWVLGFIAIVLAEAFNPRTGGLLKALGGFRQQLEWVPFFFFGYVLMRSKVRFRRFFLILGVIALANGVMATYQTRLSPAQVASWGPGYHNRIYPASGGGRSYVSEGEGRVRPFGLGSDSGFSGGVGLLTLPLMLALLATWRGRRRWITVVLTLGALVGIVTGLGRLQVVGAAIGVLAFVGLSSVVARRVSRPLAAVLGIVALAIPLGALFVSAEGSGTFSRYESISPSKVTSTSTSYKSKAWTKIPHDLAAAPFGVGLGTVGAASSFGGKVTELEEGHGVTAETQYNFLADELGAPGLILWVALALNVILLAVRGLRHIGDTEMRIYLAAVVAPIIALLLMGFSGPLSTSAALGPYFWFAAGIAAYWFVGRPRQLEAKARAA
jgi:hypothetical protein